LTVWRDVSSEPAVCDAVTRWQEIMWCKLLFVASVFWMELWAGKSSTTMDEEQSMFCENREQK
jgi:hypothetical protein